MDRRVLRGALAVVAGFLTMGVLVVVLMSLADVATGRTAGEPSGGYLMLNVLGSVVAAFAGGWVTARVAPGAMWPVWALVGAIVVLGSPGVVGGPAPGQPAWYPIATVLIGGVGAALGGMLGRPERAAAEASATLP